MKQFTELRAKASFQFKVPGTRGRSVMVNEGDLLLVTSSSMNNKEIVRIDRANKPYLNIGYDFPISVVNQWLEVV